MKLLNSGFLFSQIRKKTSFFLSLVFRLITFISFYQRATPVAIRAPSIYFSPLPSLIGTVANFLSVALNDDRAVLVRAQNLGSGFLIACDYFFSRQAEGISKSHRENRQAGFHCGDKLLCAGRETAVAGNLEYRTGQVNLVLEQHLLLPFLDIPGKENVHPAETQAYHDRGVAAFLLRRIKDTDAHLLDIAAGIVAAEKDPFYSRPFDRFLQIIVAHGATLAESGPELRRRKLLRDTFHAAVMVHPRVTHKQIVDLKDLA